MNAIKLTYITVGTVLLLASCAKEDVAPGSLTDDYRIIFRTSLPEVTSRATVVGKDDIKEFHVTAFNPDDITLKDAEGNLSEYINNELVEKDEYRGYYKSESCQWPEQGQEENELTFFAYYPVLNGETTTLENASTITDGVASINYAIKNFRIASNIEDQVDLITAYTKGSMVENMFSGISLNFNHKLSRIEVRAKSDNKSCKLEIAGVRIGGLCPQATYNFKAEDGAGDWTLSDERDNVEYLYRPEDQIVTDQIVTLDNTIDAISLMGGKNGVNYAMLIPFSYTSWDFSKDHKNSNNGIYLSVLLRVIDKTETGNGTQQYPYHDNSQGLNAMNIDRVYLAVDNDGKITANPGKLYKGTDGKYYTDEAKTVAYAAPQGSTVKEFGWAALPITANWEPGYAYTYTLDYTSGVGLHDPSVMDPQSGLDTSFPGPKAGDPIISDRVGVSVSVNDWQGDNKGNQNTINDVVVPGS